MWRNIDDKFISSASKFSESAFRYLRINFPYMLAGWRLTFIGAFFVCSAAFFYVFDSWLRYLPIVIAVLASEAHRNVVKGLIDDGRKDWDKSLYKKFAAKAEISRGQHVTFRLVVVVLCLYLTISSAADMAMNHEPLQVVLNLSLLVYSIAYTLGVYLDAAPPPLPDDGDYQLNAVPNPI